MLYHACLGTPALAQDGDNDKDRKDKRDKDSDKDGKEDGFDNWGLLGLLGLLGLAGLRKKEDNQSMSTAEQMYHAQIRGFVKIYCLPQFCYISLLQIFFLLIFVASTTFVNLSYLIHAVSDN